MRALELVRELHEHPTSRFGLVLAGVDIRRKVGREPMLKSRVGLCIPYARLHGDALVTFLRQMSPVWTSYDAGLLQDTDDLSCRGDLRQWVILAEWVRSMTGNGTTTRPPSTCVRRSTSSATRSTSCSDDSTTRQRRADSLPGVDDHDHYLQLLSLAVDDPSYVPLVLHSETRRGISVALSELLLYCGRAQPTPQLHLRAPLRNESGRVVVALRETRQTLMVFAAEQLHHLDVYLFSNIAERAGVDLWLVPQSRLPRMTRTACERVGAAETSLREALAKLTSSDSRGRRREPDRCAGALQLGGDLSARCEEHEHAGQCAVAAFRTLWWALARPHGRASPSARALPAPSRRASMGCAVCCSGSVSVRGAGSRGPRPDWGGTACAEDCRRRRGRQPSGAGWPERCRARVLACADA